VIIKGQRAEMGQKRMGNEFCIRVVRLPSSCNYTTDEMYIYYKVVFSRRGKRLNYSSGEVYKAKTRAK